MKVFLGFLLLLVSLAVSAQEATPKDKWLANLRPMMSQSLCKGVGSPFARIFKGTPEECVLQVESLLDTCAKNDSHVVLPAMLTSTSQADHYGQVLAECVAAHYLGGEQLKAFYLLQDSSVSATTTTITVPGQGTISFEVPPMNKISETNSAEQYKYAANSGRLNLSIFVEPPKCEGGQTHEAVAKCFTSKIDQTPGIVKSTVSTECVPTYCDVAYLVMLPVGGRTIRELNINVLFVFHGKWVDVHLSMINPTTQDLQSMNQFEKSISYN